jgi:hypothetical protein
MNKVLQSMRARKSRAVDRMELIHLKAKSEGRDLTNIEQLKFDLAKEEAEGLVGVISELEREIASGAFGYTSAPVQAPSAPEPSYLFLRH